MLELAAGERRPRRPRGHGRPLALGQDRRPAGGDDRLRLRRRLRRSSPRRGPWRAPRGRALPAAGRGARRSPCSPAGCGQSGRPPTAGSRWSRRPPRSATGSARSAATPSRSTRCCSRTPTRTSTSRGPATSRRAAGAALVFANGDGLDAWIDEVVSDSGSDAEVVDLGAAVPDRLPGEAEGDEASEYDPHWWHDPRNAEAAVRRDRASPRRRGPRPPRRRSSATPSAYLGRLRRARPRHRPLHRRGAAPRSASWSPTTTPSATSPTATGSRSSAR